MSRFDLSSRLGAGSLAVAAIAATMSVSACGGVNLCSSALPSNALGGGTANASVQAGTQPADALPASKLTFGASTSAGQANSAQGQAKAASTASLPASSLITLPTGQQVRLSVGSDGQQSASPVLPSGSAKPAAATGFMHFTWAGDQYLIPDDAVPYLGTTLDPRLFDVSYLARAQAANPHAAALPATVTPAGGGAAAPMTRAVAARLGQALASGWHAGRTTATRAGLAQAGLSQVSLAPRSGVASPPAGLPTPASAGGAGTNLPRHTITVKFTGTDGKPAAAAGWVQNLQNSRYGTFFVLPSAAMNSDGDHLVLSGTTGPLQFSVPDGTYSLQFSIFTPHQGSILSTDAALVVKPDVDVHGDMTVTLDARAAVPYHAAPADPVQHNLQVDTLSYFRGSATGGGCGSYQTDLGLGLLSVSGPKTGAQGGATDATQLSATPTGQVTDGTLGFVASTSIGDITSDDAHSWPDGPEYDMSFPYWGQIPSSLSFNIAAKDFTTVSHKLYVDQAEDCPVQDYRTLTGYALEPWGDWQRLGGLAGWNSKQSYWPPGSYTSYLYSGDSKLMAWQFEDSYAAGCDNDNNGRYLYRTTPLLTSHPGEKLIETWAQGPAVPSAAAVPLGSPVVALTSASGFGRLPVPVNPLLTVAPAARQDNNAMLNLSPAADADPSHAGVADYATVNGQLASTVNFYRDGKLAAGGAMVPAGGLDLPLLARPASYRLDWAWTNPVQQESTTTTSWQFTSSPGDAAAKLPENEQCAPDASRACSLLPLLFLNYDLPLSIGNQAQAGTTMPFGITVSSQQGAAAPSGVKVTVAASFDDGKTWSTAQPAASAGGNKFTASIEAPVLSATDGFASLRVTAADGAGNSVTQTIIRAYGLTS